MAIAYLLLGSTVQDHGRPDDAVVILVQVLIVWRLEVRQHKHRLKLCILPVAKLLDIVSLDAGLIDVLCGTGTQNRSQGENVLC